MPDVAFALLALWIFNPLYGPLNLVLDSIGAPTPQWLTDPHDARWAVVLMSLFQIGEGFIVALAVRQSLPDDLFELAEIEARRPVYVFAGDPSADGAGTLCCSSGTRSSASRRTSSRRC